MKFITKIQVHVPKFGEPQIYVTLPNPSKFCWGDKVQVNVKFIKEKERKKK